MSFFPRSVGRLLHNVSPKSNTCFGSFGSSLQSQYFMQPAIRSLSLFPSSSVLSLNKHVKLSPRLLEQQKNGIHTKGDKEFVDFLQNEITMERKNLCKFSGTLDDFSIIQDDAVLVFKRKFQDEEITITLNINHTVADSSQEGEEGSELLSRPDFEVDIKIGSKTLSLTCQFRPQTDITEGDHTEDDFGISEVTMHEGNWEDKTYCVSGEILDEVMYDMFMNMLEERGITNEFALKLCKVATDYEHSQFIKLLENLENFIKRK